MRIGTLGDEGNTNWAFNHLRGSWGAVGSQTYVPHVQSTNEDGRIYFEPGGHFPCFVEPDKRSRYRINGGGVLTSNYWVFLFGPPNDVTVVIPMDKLTLCHPGFGSDPAIWPGLAYLLMQGFFPSTVELPTQEQVKADNSIEDAR